MEIIGHHEDETLLIYSFQKNLMESGHHKFQRNFLDDVFAEITVVVISKLEIAEVIQDLRTVEI
jgi:hypothetical protein